MADDAIVVEENLVEEPVKIANKIESGLSRMLDGYRKDNGNGNGNELTDPYSDLDLSKFTDLSEDDIKQTKSLKDKDLMFKALERANDWKKWQRIADERHKENEKLKTSGSVPTETKYKDDEVDELLNDIRTDALTAFKKHKEKYNLPDVDFLQKQVESGGSIGDRLEQYQESKLKKEIEKQFKLEDGTFVYDASEAYKPKTPSYEFRTKSETYEKQLNKEFEEQEEHDKSVIKSMLTERESQLKRLKELYYPVDNTYELEKDETKKAELKQAAEAVSDSAFNSKLAELDAAWEKMKQGDFTSKGNPLTVENVFRGYFFNDLVKQEVDKAIRDIHIQYNQKSMYLRDEKGMPIDVTKMKGSPPTEEPKNNKFTSPLGRMKQRYSTL